MEKSSDLLVLVTPTSFKKGKLGRKSKVDKLKSNVPGITIVDIMQKELYKNLRVVSGSLESMGTFEANKLYRRLPFTEETYAPFHQWPDMVETQKEAELLRLAHSIGAKKIIYVNRKEAAKEFGLKKMEFHADKETISETGKLAIKGGKVVGEHALESAKVGAGVIKAGATKGIDVLTDDSTNSDSSTTIKEVIKAAKESATRTTKTKKGGKGKSQKKVSSKQKEIIEKGDVRKGVVSYNAVSGEMTGYSKVNSSNLAVEHVLEYSSFHNSEFDEDADWCFYWTEPTWQAMASARLGNRGLKQFRIKSHQSVSSGLSVSISSGLKAADRDLIGADAAIALQDKKERSEELEIHFITPHDFEVEDEDLIVGWSPEDGIALLKSIHLEKLLEESEEARDLAEDPRILTELDDETLTELGIEKKIYRIRLLSLVKGMKKSVECRHPSREAKKEAEELCSYCKKRFMYYDK